MINQARVLSLALCCALLAGCAVVAQGPITALVAVDMKGPVSLGPATGSAKVGRSEAWGILVYATGDASIATAMKNGGIKRAHHVDNETMTILGIYSKYTTIVYGE
jgi:TRL-like protein family